MITSHRLLFGDVDHIQLPQDKEPEDGLLDIKQMLLSHQLFILDEDLILNGRNLTIKCKPEANAAVRNALKLDTTA